MEIKGLRGGNWINEWRKRSRNFGFSISFSTFQDLGVARVVERDYVRGTDTLQAMRLREKIEETGSLLLGSVTIRECQFVL